MHGKTQEVISAGDFECRQQLATLVHVAYGTVQGCSRSLRFGCTSCTSSRSVVYVLPVQRAPSALTSVFVVCGVPDTVR